MRPALLLAALALAACSAEPDPGETAAEPPGTGTTYSERVVTDVPDPEAPGVGLQINAPTLDPAPAGGRARLAFDVVNGGPADVLRGASTDLGTAQLRTATGGLDADASDAVTEIPVPAESATVLSRDALHVLVSDLVRALAPGDTVDVVLTFERAGDVPVRAVVRGAAL